MICIDLPKEIIKIRKLSLWSLPVISSPFKLPWQRSQVVWKSNDPRAGEISVLFHCEYVESSVCLWTAISDDSLYAAWFQHSTLERSEAKCPPWNPSAVMCYPQPTRWGSKWISHTHTQTNVEISDVVGGCSDQICLFDPKFRDAWRNIACNNYNWRKHLCSQCVTSCHLRYLETNLCGQCGHKASAMEVDSNMLSDHSVWTAVTCPVWPRRMCKRSGVSASSLMDDMSHLSRTRWTWKIVVKQV